MTEIRRELRDGQWWIVVEYAREKLVRLTPTGARRLLNWSR